MNYYRVRYTLNKKKVFGNYPQVKEVKHHCSVDNDPRFIRHFRLKKIDFEPIVSTPILYAKSKKTDLIEKLGIGFSHRLVISGKLKNILKQYRNDGFQYFQCPIFHKGVEDKAYWIMNVFKTNEEYINYKESEIKWERMRMGSGPKYGIVKIVSLRDFNKKKEFHRKNHEYLYVKRIVLKEQVKDDFFVLNHIEGGLGYFVSEKLKQEIEEAGCTGIEFQPSHLISNEWWPPGREREKIYGKS